MAKMLARKKGEREEKDALGALFGSAKKNNKKITSIAPSGGGEKKGSLAKGNTMFDQNINQRMRKNAQKSKVAVNKKLSRVEKVRRKKKAMQAKIDGQMGTSNEDQKVGSISGCSGAPGAHHRTCDDTCLGTFQRTWKIGLGSNGFCWSIF